MKSRADVFDPAQGRDPLTKRILAAAITVHRELGPGFLDSIYEEALALEFQTRDFCFERQKIVPIFYREHHVGVHRLNFLVEREVIVELKALTAFEGKHVAIVRSYLNAAGCETGLLLNFATPALGIKRVGRRHVPTPEDADFLA